MKKLIISILIIHSFNASSQVITSDIATYNRNSLNWVIRDSMVNSGNDTYQIIINEMAEQIKELSHTNDLYFAKIELMEIKQLYCLQYKKFRDYRNCIINNK